MISPSQLKAVLKSAYVPEHLPGYVTAISPSETLLYGPFLAYQSGEVITLIGYPLEGEFSLSSLETAIEEIESRFKPASIRLTAPQLPAHFIPTAEPDIYYRLAVEGFEPDKDLRYMLRRAGRELTVIVDRDFGRLERKLVNRFLKRRQLDRAYIRIFGSIPSILKANPGTAVLRALDGHDRLAAVDVADFSAGEVGFYLFNFRRIRQPVPGASDLLLGSIIEESRIRGMPYLNLGLGIDQGVAFFKTKWGGVPYLEHHQGVWQVRQAQEQDWDGLFGKL